MKALIVIAEILAIWSFGIGVSAWSVGRYIFDAIKRDRYGEVSDQAALNQTASWVVALGLIFPIALLYGILRRIMAKSLPQMKLKAAEQRAELAEKEKRELQKQIADFDPEAVKARVPTYKMPVLDRTPRPRYHIEDDYDCMEYHD